MAKKVASEEVSTEDRVFGSIKACKPCGSQVLVEMLTEQEMLGTSLVMTNKKPLGANEFQAVVLSIGPAVNSEHWGFAVGNRVLLSGTCVPVPDYNSNGKTKVLLEPHCIKGVLAE